MERGLGAVGIRTDSSLGSKMSVYIKMYESLTTLEFCLVAEDDDMIRYGAKQYILLLLFFFFFLQSD